MPTLLQLPSRRVLRLIFLAIALLAFLAGCSEEPVGPQPVTGRYDLVSVDGSGLPAVILEETVESEEGSFLLTITVVGGYLEMKEQGSRYTHRLDFVTRIDQGPNIPYRWTDHGAVTREDTSLEFASEGIQNVAFEGNLEDGRLEVAQDMLYHLHGVSRITEFRFER